jgi:zinc transport system substrate-binding protein
MNFRNFHVMLLALVLAACGAESEPDTAAAGEQKTRPLIVASNYPLYFFSREIAGDSAEVVFPTMDGDPANWKPGGEAIALMQSADLLILNGAAYESWLDWVSLPDDIMLDTSAGIGDRLITLEDETVHQHGPEGEHSHRGLAFTIWLDPVLAMEQASAIEQAISGLVPENRQAHQASLAGLQARLAALDEALRLAFEAVRDQPLIFSHPVYQYPAARYGLDGISMHWEPGQDPGIRAWIDFRDTLRRHPANLMIWEDEPDEATVKQLGQLGVLPVTFHTASNRTAGKDYFDVMEANVDRLNSHIGKSPRKQ